MLFWSTDIRHIIFRDTFPHRPLNLAKNLHSPLYVQHSYLDHRPTSSREFLALSNRNMIEMLSSSTPGVQDPIRRSFGAHQHLLRRIRQSPRQLHLPAPRRRPILSLKPGPMDDSAPIDDSAMRQAPPISFSESGQLFLFGVEATPEVSIPRYYTTN